MESNCKIWIHGPGNFMVDGYIDDEGATFILIPGHGGRSAMSFSTLIWPLGYTIYPGWFMKNYRVTVYEVHSFDIDVEAENEDQAIEKANEVIEEETPIAEYSHTLPAYEWSINEYWKGDSNGLFL